MMCRPSTLRCPRDTRARGGSLTGLFGDLWRQTTTLVHQEAALAKAELSEKIGHMALGIGGIAAGGAVIFAGFIILLSSAVNALAPYLPPNMAAWLSPLIVGWSSSSSATSSMPAGRARWMQAT